MKKQKTRDKLYIICAAVKFDKMPENIIRDYESFPYIIDKEQITDDFVWGVQEITSLISSVFLAKGQTSESATVVAYGSAILYHWWKINVHDNEFTHITEIEVKL